MTRLASILAGSQHDENKKLTVWIKGHPIPGYDPSEWRRDDFDSAMRYSDYGNRNSDYGWELDHFPVPASMGGLDEISNLRPLNWKNNARHGGFLGNR